MAKGSLDDKIRQAQLASLQRQRDTVWQNYMLCTGEWASKRWWNELKTLDRQLEALRPKKKRRKKKKKKRKFMIDVDEDITLDDL